MGSRLDRLVVLLDTGSTPFIKNTAADQLADISKSHADDSINLLSRVYPFLKNKKWETRVAAARAFGGIVNNTSVWDPNKIELEEELLPELFKIKEEQNENTLSDLLQTQDSLFIDFAGWNIQETFQHGKKLLASGGNEFNDYTKMNGKDVDLYKKQRTSLNSRLGFGPKLEETDIMDIEPVKNEVQEPLLTPQVKQEVSQTIPSESNNSSTPQDTSSKQSARMRALARRKAKADAKNPAMKNKVVDLSQSSVSRELVNRGVSNKDLQSNELKFDITTQSNSDKLVLETKQNDLESDSDKPSTSEAPIFAQHSKVSKWVWPFQGVYELLLIDLFNEQWEIRHGATLGLRELVKKHAPAAGRVRGKSKEENDLRNYKTLEDLTVRLLILFSLDRFGDYVSDTVVAPVRENAAQTLAALLIHLPEPIVLQAFQALKTLALHKPEDLGLETPVWEVKHAGMSGLRYFVSVRTDILFSHTELLDDVIAMVLHGLTESDDDVQSVALSTLIPIASDFVKLKLNSVFQIVSVIWNSLTNLSDDLSASIGSVMDLLAKLCSHKEVLEKMKKDAQDNNDLSFKLLVPRLYPFFRHSITDVRKSVLRTLLLFLKIDDSSMKDWIDGKVLRLIFQNILFEQNQQVLQLSVEVYEALIHEVAINKTLNKTMESLFQEHMQPSMTLLMTPIGISRYNYSMNQSLIMKPSGLTYAGNKLTHRHSSGTSVATLSSQQIPHVAQLDPLEPGEDVKELGKRGRKRKTTASPEEEDVSNSGIPFEDHRINIDTPIFNGDITLVGIDVFIRTKVAAAISFGKTIAYYDDEQQLEEVGELLTYYLKAPHSTPKLMAAIVVEEYAKMVMKLGKKPCNFFKTELSPVFNTVLMENTLKPFRELIPTLKNIRMQCLQLFNTFQDIGKLSPHKLPQLAVVVKGDVQAGPDAFGVETLQKFLDEQYDKLVKSLSPTYRMNAMTALDSARERVKLAIEDAISLEQERVVQVMASYASLALALDGVPKKLNYVIRSLMDSVKQENEELLQKRSSDAICRLVIDLLNLGKKGPADKIVKNLCAFLCVDTSEVPEFGSTRGLEEQIFSLRKEERTDPLDIAEFEKFSLEAKRKRRGAQLTLENFLVHFEDKLFDQIPRLKQIVLDLLDMLEKPFNDPIFEDDVNGQAVVDALGILRVLVPKLHPTLFDLYLEKFPTLLLGLKSEFAVFRYSVARCLSTSCAHSPMKVFPFLVRSVLPLLKNAGKVNERQGAIECIYHLANEMGSDILPYVVFLIVPVLGRMSDSNKDVRTLATTTFASIIKLVPLEAGIPDPQGMPQDLLEGRERERDFIQQMMDPSKIKPFEMPVAIKATLRKYQQEGINWLAFLNKYHLHGILCDDMGLGKTLQTICIVASDQFIRAENYAKTKELEFRPLPSLIVGPPSLTGHWEQEFNQYAPGLSVLVYAGGPSVRAPMRESLTNYDVIVTSYDVVRNDIEILSLIDYNYCVLDEGHIIKNASTKLSKSVKRLKAEHRLILSGTPIQNNVLELWSLFDFLMPGFLGSEKYFQEKFAKPIAASRNSKTSSKEQEAGALALESLHKQTLPFMLRRLKEDVLSDLPPKIIQDYYCELSDLQKQLYNDFAKKQKTIVSEDIADVSEDSSKQHIFQALQYMRKLCNHPALVVTPNHPQYLQVQKYLKDSNMTLEDIRHAPKLQSLETLLFECGIGAADMINNKSKNLVNPADLVISQHRALIFCQLKDMLDMIENDLFKKYMPSVTYMRLDGSTDPRDRQKIVRNFNEDPSIDVLLLTTKVGGLGLNLTGADTVIFVEHDWNPMNDLQAMDRAHRLGQKKVVNVYRLITKNTLEEKIMGLQKFKMNIASTVINQQNGGLNSMDTNQLLDLFEVDDESMKLTEKEQEKPDEIDESGLGGKAGAAVGELGELWDNSQYEEEYNLDNFIKSLR